MAVVKADLGLCQGYGNCVLEAEDYFDLGDDGVVALLVPTVADEDLGRVERAVGSCPVSALAIAGQDAGAG